MNTKPSPIDVKTADRRYRVIRTRTYTILSHCADLNTTGRGEKGFGGCYKFLFEFKKKKKKYYFHRM